MELPPYNYMWNEDKTGKYQSGTAVNAWWYHYRKFMKQKGIIKELKLTVSEALLYYNDQR